MFRYEWVCLVSHFCQRLILEMSFFWVLLLSETEGLEDDGKGKERKRKEKKRNWDSMLWDMLNCIGKW